jgi:hypothetical protein
MNHTNITRKVQSFIDRLHDGEYVIDQKANFMMYSTGSVNKSLAAYLAEEMHEYEILSDLLPNIKAASSCLIWIDRAFACGYVRESDGMAKKLHECESEIKELKTQIKTVKEETEKYATDLVFIQGKYDELKELTSNILPKKDDDIKP